MGVGSIRDELTRKDVPGVESDDDLTHQRLNVRIEEHGSRQEQLRRSLFPVDMMMMMMMMMMIHQEAASD